MKKLVMILVIMLMASESGVSQPRMVDRSFEAANNETITLDLKYGNSISVESWNKNKVSFKASIEINNGKLNDALKLTFNHKDGQLQITSDYDKETLKSSHEQDCNGRDDLRYSVSGKNGSYAICHKISYLVIIPQAADFDVNSINANIELVNLAGPVRAKSISGFVDLSRPANIPTDVKLKTVSGKIYTDVNITEPGNNNYTTSEYPPHIFKGTIKGGGDELLLESISGDIYLRKTE